jgi:hypothetical protein
VAFKCYAKFGRNRSLQVCQSSCSLEMAKPPRRKGRMGSAQTHFSLSPWTSAIRLIYSVRCNSYSQAAVDAASLLLNPTLVRHPWNSGQILVK